VARGDLMQAAVLHRPGRLSVDRIPAPAPGPGDVLVAVEHCGVCGTDIHIAAGRFPVPELPLVLGHEFAGTVAAVGGDVRAIAPGARVAVDVIVPCDVCHACRHGRPHLCEAVRELGVHVPGGLAEYVAVPQRNVHALPERVSLREAALIEPLACAIHGQDRAEVQLGDDVAVIGAGAQGLLHVLLARMRGAARVIVSARHAGRRARAMGLGADLAIDSAGADPAGEIRAATGGRGADVVIDAAGTAEAYEHAVRSLRRGGRLLVYGAAPRDVPVPLTAFEVFERELSIVGSYGGTGDTWPRAIGLIASGRLDLDALVDREWPLAQAPAALETLAGDRSLIKGRIVVGKPGESVY
jgi:2-desacetyl-2-hydroxyethyl bacteriochlorophyllide A dehydrogenase